MKARIEAFKAEKLSGRKKDFVQTIEKVDSMDMSDG